jgi:hypothetical protein
MSKVKKPEYLSLSLFLSLSLSLSRSEKLACVFYFGPKPDPGKPDPGNKASVRLGSEGIWVKGYGGEGPGRPPFWRTPRKEPDPVTREGA